MARPWQIRPIQINCWFGVVKRIVYLVELYIVRGCLLVVEFCDYFRVLYSVGVCTCTCNRLCE